MDSADDFIVSHRIVITCLPPREFGFAFGGKHALDLIGEACPDIMLLDVVMPGMDGFEVLKELRTTSELPVIVLSARPENAQTESTESRS